MIGAIIQTPPDGFTHYERIIARDVVISIYRNLGNSTDKFIICAIMECGYSQTDLARILQCSQAFVSKRLKRILRMTRAKHKNNKL
jgi:hypothetical protein